MVGRDKMRVILVALALALLVTSCIKEQIPFQFSPGRTLTVSFVADPATVTRLAFPEDSLHPEILGLYLGFGDRIILPCNLPRELLIKVLVHELEHAANRDYPEIHRRIDSRGD
jgi:hypothetical protein